ncbi:hypothetical protein AKJ43_02430 [candidate division MSBL1 archaeon SCGC-AAA261D19]|uniref:Uncharacterized protein n=1 Tax=candidate division MSBL1 archaeon SCGC-AAA261D19 TaxID=1698273 RepID=A0A133V6P5_9EURY|nr:hypothetical protein AKJ43_02430 [candidate division MSBL1 archaeon SCGC-AAA261D19]
MDRRAEGQRPTRSRPCTRRRSGGSKPFSFHLRGGGVARGVLRENTAGGGKPLSAGSQGAERRPARDVKREALSEKALDGKLWAVGGPFSLYSLIPPFPTVSLSDLDREGDATGSRRNGEVK